MLSLFFLIFLFGFSFSERLVFEDDFNGDAVNQSKWKFDQTLSGGGDWQFQWFVRDEENAFVRDGALHIRPTLTADKFGEDALYKKKVSISKADCSSSLNYGCYREGTSEHIINPIRSASIQAKKSFKYGTVEIRAKLPSGDWLRPSIKLLPKRKAYGDWPASGEIVLLEARGNRQLKDQADESVGNDQVTSTLHFGPSYNQNGWRKAHFAKAIASDDFHIYKLDWSKTGIKFFIDDEMFGEINVEPEGFWKIGEFAKHDEEDNNNPWAEGTPMAPFDKEFFVTIGLAVGGVSGYFSDDYENAGYEKPWSNKSPHAPLEFWRAKENWLKTWKSPSPDSADFQIDYVKIFSK